MEYYFRKADINDLEFITNIRIKVLKIANKLEKNIDMSNVFSETLKYYSKYLNDNNNITYLGFDNDKFIACGSICFFDIMPTYNNQSGKNAYIMNMYTDENYRRKGIGSKILDLMIKNAKEKGVEQIQLEATEMGKYLYKKYGFVDLLNEMELGK